MQKVQIFKIREDGTFDFSDSIVPETPNELNYAIENGYGIPDVMRQYKDTGEPLTFEELEAIRNAPVPLSEVDLLGQQMVVKELQILELESKLQQSEQDKDLLGQQIVDLDIRLMMGGM